MKQQTIILPLLLLFLLGLIWGSGYAIAKFAMQNGVSPLGYAFWQSLGPAILVGCAALSQRSNITTVRPSRQLIFFYFICGLIGIALPNTNMYFVAAHLPAGMLAVIVNTVPVLTYVLAISIQQERFSWLRCSGVIFAVTGIMLLALPKANLPTPAAMHWTLLALISPLCFAVCVIFIAGQRPKGNSLLHSAGMLLFSAILLTPLVIATHNFYPLWPPFNLAQWVIILEIILSSLGYVLFFHLLKIAGPVFYSLVSGVVALTGLMWGWIIFGEHLTLFNTLTIGLVLLGIFLVSVRQKRLA